MCGQVHASGNGPYRLMALPLVRGQKGRPVELKGAALIAREVVQGWGCERDAT